MISEDDNPGLFYFLVGIVVLVMAGVGLSILVDKRFQFSKGSIEAGQELTQGSSTLTELRLKVESRAAQLAAVDAKRRNDAAHYEQALVAASELRDKNVALSAKRVALGNSIEALDQEFVDYRAKYVRRVRDSAVGEKVASLTLRGGRSYPAASISRVTEEGLEIRHEHGTARIAAGDLDSSWSERFLWGDEGRRVRSKQASQHGSAQPGLR
jgi:hypothetical protein